MTQPLHERLRQKARHGLILQEILNRIGHWGFLLRPYIVYLEGDPSDEGETQTPSFLSIRELTPADIPALLSVPLHAVPEGEFEKRFAAGDLACAAFDKDRLIAFTWAHLREFPGIGGGSSRRPLEADEAYLYDAYTDPDYRGYGTVMVLRKRLYQLLSSRGRRRCYSISLMFNRSARRFKEKLRARELERRLAIRFLGRFHADMVLGRNG